MKRQDSTGGNKISSGKFVCFFVFVFFFFYFSLFGNSVFDGQIIYLIIYQGFIFFFHWPLFVCTAALFCGWIQDFIVPPICCRLNSRWSLTTLPLDDICCYFICQFCLLALHNHICVHLRTRQQKHTPLNNDCKLWPAALSGPGCWAQRRPLFSREPCAAGGRGEWHTVDCCMWWC